MSIYQKFFIKQLTLELEALQPIYIQKMKNKENKENMFTNVTFTMRMKIFHIKSFEILLESCVLNFALCKQYSNMYLNNF